MILATSLPPASRRPIPDEEARRRIREDLRDTLIVEAAAGTGKTTMLVARIVAVLRAGVTELDRIVAVTFTEKAAGEMKLRLRAGLERARTEAGVGTVERRRLDGALAQLEVARIGTIHSLCSDLLREQPVEARVDPLFEVAPEDEAERLFDQSFEGWFQETLKDPPEGVRRILRRPARGRDRIGPRQTLRDAAWRLVGHRDFTAPWRRDPLDRDAAIDAILVDLRGIGELAAKAYGADDYLARNLDTVHRFMQELDRRELVRPRDHDGLEAELGDMIRTREWKWRGAGAYGRGLTRADVLAKRDAVRAKLEALIERTNADLAACLHEELRPLAARYDELKARSGKLDFLDLLLRARDLVRDDRSIREELSRRFSHLFIDEFQDTDPLQAEILLLLAADDPDEKSYTAARPVPGKLFLVGDPKQSIYRFRRADVALYEGIKARLLAGGAQLLYLTTSFRSAPAIQDAVNAAFAPVMQGSAEGSQARYVALEHFREPALTQPAVIAFPVPCPYGDWGKITSYAIDMSLPDAIGAFVDWLVRESGWTVTERDQGDARVPIGARHICLLFKRFQSWGDDVTRAYVRALEARRVPHVLVGGRSFHDREEVQAVRNALVSIEWPDDELSVYATLRGPFFALADDALLAYRQAAGDGKALGPLHPLRPAPAEVADADRSEEGGGIGGVADALAILRELHVHRNRRPIADTIERLLEATRAHAGIAIWPTGEQSLANVLRMMDLARRFEAAGATSFRAFVERLDADAEGGAAGEAPVVEEGTEGVRIMTVHRAKGLEFPVVILCDPTAPTTLAQPTRHVDQDAGLWAEALAGCMPAELLDQREAVLRRDREEAIRLAYVAATRARDLLVVPVVGDEEQEGWLDVLNPVLYPWPIDRRFRSEAPGCPKFWEDSVLERSSRVERTTDDSVAPGAHKPRAGNHEVVWWDPRALNLGREPEGGLRQQRILAADESRTVSEEGIIAHRAWSERRAHVLATGSVATLPITTVTALAEQALAALPKWQHRLPAAHPEAVELATTGVTRKGRPRGKRFGTLVHAVLAEVDLAAGEPGVRAVARAEGRQIGASADEIDASVTAVLEALRHSIMQRAAASAALGYCRRETPILLPGSDGVLIEGVIDLAFRETTPEGHVWTVVDFKTDSELADRRARYETQVLLYVDAVRAATGEQARGVLLSV